MGPYKIDYYHLIGDKAPITLRIKLKAFYDVFR